MSGSLTQRVVIAEDHALTLQGLEVVLATAGDLEVVGRAADGDTAIELVKRVMPDLLCLDLMLPGRNGNEVLQAVCGQYPALQVLVISGQTSLLDFRRAIQMGAAGVVSKNDNPESILAAIRAIRDKRTPYISPALEKRLDPQVAPRDGLTRREGEVLTLLADGRTSQQIAEALNISDKTVRKHRENILRKLEAHTAVEALNTARRLGLVGSL